jgi:two-component system sensor kinase FixL
MALDDGKLGGDPMGAIKARLLDAVPVCLAYVDADRRYQYVNATYERWFGIRLDDARGRLVSEVLDSELWDRLEPHVAAALSGERVELTVDVGGDGEHRVTRAIYIPDAVGPDVVGFFLVAMDLTQMYDARAHAEGELAALVAHAHDAVIGSGLDGVITSWNPAAARMYGCSAEEAVGKHISLVAPDGLEDIEDVLEIVSRGEHVNHHLAERPGNDGADIVASLTVSPVTGADGTVIGAVTVARDITEMFEAEQAVRARDRRLNELVHTTQDAVIFIDGRSRICRFNAAAEEIFGYAAQEAHGEDVSLLMPEPHASEHGGYIERYERTGEPRAIGRIRTTVARRKTGEVFPIEISITKLADDEVRYAAFIRDITEKSELHDKLVASERLAAVGSTASVFAHEVGNPLNNLYLYVQLLSRRVKKLGVADQLEDDLGAIAAEVQRLTRLLDEFRAFYRSDRSEHVPVDPNKLLEDVCRRERLVAQQQGGVVDVVCDIPDPLPEIRANPDRLRQVLVNLVKNAIEAMPEGGTLTVQGDVEDDAVRIEVRDTGDGIEPEVDVFQPFKTTKPDGTGLGLPVVQQIVEAHGGTVGYESKPGRGTTFVVRLPLGSDASPTSA